MIRIRKGQIVFSRASIFNCYFDSARIQLCKASQIILKKIGLQNIFFAVPENRRLRL